MRDRIIRALFPGAIEHGRDGSTIDDAMKTILPNENAFSFSFQEGKATWVDGPVTFLAVTINGTPEAVHVSAYPGALTMDQRDDICMQVGVELQERFDMATRGGPRGKA